MWLSVVYATAFVLMLAILHATWRYHVHWFNFDFVPHFRNSPWVGSALYFHRDSYRQLKLLTLLAAQHCSEFLMWFGPLPVVVTGKLGTIADLLQSNVLIDKSFGRKFVQEWLGDSLLMLNGDKWKRRRLLLTPALHYGVLRDYTKVFEANAQLLTATLATTHEEYVDVQPIMHVRTLNIICQTAMRVQPDSNDAKYAAYSEAVSRIKQLVLRRVRNPLLHPGFIFRRTNTGRQTQKCLDTINEFVKSVIEERIKKRCNDENIARKRKSFLDTMLDAYEQSEVTVQELIDECNMFIFAGHDTTSSALSFTLYTLGLHPQMQARLREEMIKSRSNPLLNSTKERAAKLPYLEMFLKEVMRLYATVPFFNRSINHNSFVNGNYYKAGSTISVSPYLLHRNPEVWPDPLRFDPERFTLEKCATRHPFSYVPFSAGPRNCLGQKFAMLEIKILVCEIVARFEIVTNAQEDVQFSYDAILFAQNGLWVKFIPIMAD